VAIEGDDLFGRNAVEDSLAPARGLACALLIGATAWLVLLVAVVS